MLLVTVKRLCSFGLNILSYKHVFHIHYIGLCGKIMVVVRYMLRVLL